jgi:hypothetical protein
MLSVTRRAATMLLLALTGGCSLIRHAQDERVVDWQRSGITIDEAREILGTTPYAIPDLEIVAIHADRTKQVVMVEQRLKPGVLIALSQLRGYEPPSRARDFLAFERYSLERVAYTPGPSTGRYVRPFNTMGLPPSLARRWFTRYTDELTIRIWGDAMTPEAIAQLLQTAEPIGDARR